MAQRKATPERLSAFSDGVFSVIITMVLELNPPDHPTFAALLPLWPTGLSYVVSYVFIAIVWVNHHHVLQYAEAPTPRLIWRNFRSPVLSFARAVFDRLDGPYSIGRSTSRFARGSICAGKPHVCGAVVGDIRTSRGE